LNRRHEIIGGAVNRVFPGQEIHALWLVSQRWGTELYFVDVLGKSGIERYVLRRFVSDDSVRQCQHEAQILTYLKKYDFPSPNLIAHLANEDVGHDCWTIAKYIHGNTLDEPVAQSKCSLIEQYLEQFVKLLARLHQIPLQGIEIKSLETLLDYKSEIVDSNIATRARKIFSNYSWGIEFAQLIDWAESQLAMAGEPIKVLVHNDYHPGNIVKAPDGTLNLIDWVDARITDIRFELGWVLMLADAYGSPKMRDKILSLYKKYHNIETGNIEIFEIIAALRRIYLRNQLALNKKTFGVSQGGPVFRGEDVDHLRKICNSVFKITGIRLVSVEGALNRIR